MWNYTIQMSLFGTASSCAQLLFALSHVANNGHWLSECGEREKKTQVWTQHSEIQAHLTCGPRSGRALVWREIGPKFVQTQCHQPDISKWPPTSLELTTIKS